MFIDYQSFHFPLSNNHVLIGSNVNITNRATRIESKISGNESFKFVTDLTRLGMAG